MADDTNYQSLVKAAGDVIDEFCELVTPYPEGAALIGAIDRLDALLVAQGQRETDDLVIQDRADSLAAGQ